MAHDLLFGPTKKNWSRGAVTAPSVSQPKLVLTAEEKSRLEKLAVVKMRAEAGDRGAKKHWAKLRGDLAKLRARARKGDRKAARLRNVVDASGLFGEHQQNFNMSRNDPFPNPFGGQTSKPMPRRPNPFPVVSGVETIGDESRDRAVSAIIELYNRAVGGDVESKKIFDGIAARAQQGDRRAMDLMNVVVQAQQNTYSKGATEILGSFVGDESRAEQESCGYSPDNDQKSRRRSHRRRRLSKMIARASQGDAQASSRLQAMTSRLQQRASQGDQRAQTLLARIQARQGSAQIQTPFNPAFQTYPASTTQTTYPASSYQPAYASAAYPPAAPAPVSDEVVDAYV